MFQQIEDLCTIIESQSAIIQKQNKMILELQSALAQLGAVMESECKIQMPEDKTYSGLLEDGDI